MNILYEDEIIIYLNKLWNGRYIKTNSLNIFNIFNYIANLYYCFMNIFTISIVKNNIPNLKKIGFTFYNENNKNEQPIDNKISKKEIKYVIDFKNGNTLSREKIMNNMYYCTVFIKHKSGNLSNPDNYRYYINHPNIIKILDRLWYYEVLKKCNKLPDSEIFKVSFNNSNSLSIVANNNTLSKNNVLLLDIIKAYDSIEWNILEDLLYHNLKRKMNILYATEYIQQYMIILTNRIIKYNNKNINISKGIPTGLPSSILVFTFIMEEIIIRWMKINNFLNNIDFIINIYVDDIYIKILNISKTHLIISSLINQFNKYKLFINFNKSRIDNNLSVFFEIANNFKELKNTDLYLGIPFTRNIKLYKNIILQRGLF